MAALRTALPPFLVASGGVGLAWLGFNTIWLLPVLVIAATAGLAYSVFLAGKARTSRDPVGAIRLMAWRILLPGALAAGAAGLTIAVAVWLNAPKDASADTTKLLAASVAAFSGLFATLLVKDAESADDKWVATPIRRVFESKFHGRFSPESRPALATFAQTFEGMTGWGPEARRARAAAIKAAL